MSRNLLNKRLKSMSLFKSSREKRLWLYVGLVLMAIFSTLVFGYPLLEIFGNQNIQAAIFMLGMLLIGLTIVLSGLKTQRDKMEIVVWLGFVAVYLLLFLRMGLAERSHMIEYSVLAIFMHKAFIERLGQERKKLFIGVLAFIVTFMVGILDECIQIFLPDRVFDPIDILFNGLVALLAIGGSIILQWIRNKYRKKYQRNK